MANDRSSKELDETTKRYIDQKVQEFFAKHFAKEQKALEESIQEAVFEKLQPYLQNVARATGLEPLVPPEPADTTDRARTPGPVVIPKGAPASGGATKRRLAELWKRLWRFGSPDRQKASTPARPKWSVQDWILLVSAVLVASVLGYFLVQRFWPLTQAATTPSQKAFLRSALGEQALLWFREIQAAPSSRVSDTVRNESQDWIGTIDDNSTLEPEVAKRARVALFEHIHACWWDQQAAAGTRRGDPPVVDLDASRIPKDDLQAIWKATATRDNDRYPAGPPPTDANLQLAVIRRWLSLGSSPCTLESKPGEALSQGNNSPPEAADPFALWKSLIGTRGPEVRALFAEAQTGGRPPVTVTPKASQGFKYWQGIEAAKFEGDVLGLSLTASFEYLHARWVKEKGLAGAAPTVDFDVSRIDAAALAGVRTWVGLSRPLPEGGTATTPAVQAEVVRAWLDKKKNPS